MREHYWGGHSRNGVPDRMNGASSLPENYRLAEREDSNLRIAESKSAGEEAMNDAF